MALQTVMLAPKTWQLPKEGEAGLYWVVSWLSETKCGSELKLKVCILSANTKDTWKLWGILQFGQDIRSLRIHLGLFSETQMSFSAK